MRLKISHETSYAFSQPVAYALQELRLTPKSRAGQRVLSWSIELAGARRQADFEDQHNNAVTLTTVDEGAVRVAVRCAGEVETENRSGVVGEHGGYAPLWYFRRTTPLTRPGPGLRKLAREAGAGSDADITRLHRLSSAIAAAMRYDKAPTAVTTAAEQALEAGAGVCQDHAHVFVAAARLLGFPARYVSGYLMLNAGVEQEAAHAWAEAHVRDIGWVGFDVSNGISPDERYVRVATGLDYSEAAPVTGMRYGAAAESMIVSLAVQQ
jgi:transglutaminase-like putative cysteine protease